MSNPNNQYCDGCSKSKISRCEKTEKPKYRCVDRVFDRFLCFGRTPCKEKTQIKRLPISHLLSTIHPIPIRPRRANIKKGRELRQIVKYCISQAPGPVVVLGIHLCKALSVHTIRLFNTDSNASKLYLKPCCLPGRKDLRRREPPFWEFSGMDEGGFGVKTLYCQPTKGGESITASKSTAAAADAKKEARLLSDEDAKGDQDEGCHNPLENNLFTKWVELLRDAANSADGVSAKINYCHVQKRHFQNQYIVASRCTT